MCFYKPHGLQLTLDTEHQKQLFALEDPFGPTITDGRLSVIIVSAETESGAKAINIHRIERGMDEMDVLVVGLAAHGAVSADGYVLFLHFQYVLSL